jgi:hypothetical protein
MEDAMVTLVVRAVAVFVALGVLGAPATVLAGRRLVVPRDHPTIQAAIDGSPTGSATTSRRTTTSLASRSSTAASGSATPEFAAVEGASG